MIHIFKEYLLNSRSKRKNKAQLSQNSAVSYFNKFKAGLKQAYKDGYLTSDLNSKITCVKTEEVIKETLTIEELQQETFTVIFKSLKDDLMV